MTNKNSIGDIKVVYMRNANFMDYPVADVLEARKFIDALSEFDLNDPLVDVNSFDLLAYDPSHEDAYTDNEFEGWYRWSDDEGVDINGYYT